MTNDSISGWVEADSEQDAKKWVLDHFQSAKDRTITITYNTDKNMYWFNGTLNN